MKRLALLLTIGLAVSGCDGHVRTFRPPPEAARAGAGAADQEKRLADALAEVARQRGCTRTEPKFESKDYTVIVSYWKAVDHGSLQMRLIKETRSGAYKVVMIDWPSCARSAESVAAEAAVREKLTGD